MSICFRTCQTLLFCCIAAAVSLTSAADYTWSGATSGVWDLPANWGGSGFPNAASDTATFAGTANPAIDLNGDKTVGAITFGATAASNFSLGGSGTLTLAADGSIIQAAGAGKLYTIARPLTLSGNANFTSLTNVGLSKTNALKIVGPITGSGTITITGNDTKGNIWLSGDNSGFTGNFQHGSGVLTVGSSKSLGTTAAVTQSGGQLWFEGGANTAVNFTIAGSGGAWSSYSANAQSGNIQVDSGATWTIRNGGGNALGLSGVLTGSGAVLMEVANTTLSGTANNTFNGTLTLAANSGTAQYNKLFLNKSGGATAIQGPLVVQNRGNVVWQASNQINDAAEITLAGGTLSTNGHSDVLGAVTLAGKSNIDLAGGAATLRFADSSGLDWSAGQQVLVYNWQGSATNQVIFGNSAAALTAGQLAKVGFTNPANQAPGLYRAIITTAGEIVPSATAVQAVNPAFDVSPAALAAREAIYNVPGRANLSGTDTPLTAGQRISFFGDSITWQNGYIQQIQTALASGAGTQNLGVQLFNRGINGGGAIDLLNGSPGGANNGGNNNAPQASFADVIAADQSDVAVVFIGVNDVWWKGTTPGNFQSQLEQIVAAGDAAGVKMVLATLSVQGELPDGTNANDVKLDQFAQITRDVAASTGATLVDLRAAYLAWEQNNNWQLQLDGSLEFRSQGLLTYDAVHPTALGNALLADQIAQGIFTALAVPEPASCTLGLMGLLGLGRRVAASRRAQRAAPRG